MNSALSFEIYRGLWMISGSGDSFRSMLSEARKAIFDPTQKINTFSYQDISARTGAITPSVASSENRDKISYTKISGVITKSGGSSSYGMEEISADLLRADKDTSVIGHLVKLDTPGGSVSGMRYMKATLQSLTKPLITMVSRQGMAASAGLGILVEGDYVMAESPDSEIGSHGVMWGVSGVPNGQKDANGEVNFVVIASSSPDKNKATVEAINNSDTTLMQAEVDKIHGDFKASTRSRRPNVNEAHMTGDMYPASELVGTLIDAIGSETDAVNKILELSKSNNTFNKNSNNKSTAMTAAELLAQHPTVHAEILAAGVAAERDRVETWMVYSAIDAEAVEKGIASGKLPSNREMASFNLKAASAGRLETLKKDSAANLLNPEAETKEVVESQDEKDYKALYPKAKFNPSLN